MFPCMLVAMRYNRYSVCQTGHLIVYADLSPDQNVAKCQSMIYAPNNIAFFHVTTLPKVKRILFVFFSG